MFEEHTFVAQTTHVTYHLLKLGKLSREKQLPQPCSNWVKTTQFLVMRSYWLCEYIYIYLFICVCIFLLYLYLYLHLYILIYLYMYISIYIYLYLYLPNEELTINYLTGYYGQHLLVEENWSAIICSNQEQRWLFFRWCAPKLFNMWAWSSHAQYF